jgi:hypothetical protein
MPATKSRSEDAMSAAHTLSRIRIQLRELTESLGDDETTLDEIVEVGTVLTAIENLAKTELSTIKKTIREEAIDELEDASGTAHFEGLDIGKVTVTIPKPKIGFVKGTDPEVLKTRLGDDFDLYFVTKVSYAPRSNAPELIARIATGDTRDLLLCSVEENEQTPRVSFRKV